jgi:hypothetical protein
MAKKKDTPPNTRRLEENAREASEFRASRISTLNQTMVDVEQEAKKRTRMINDELDVITRQQREAVKMLGKSDKQLTGETAKGLNEVIGHLGQAMGNFATGIGRVTTQTSRATTQAISQYGKAIGEDININKQNTVAMALSTAAPLFGYFASKFMETSVFKDASRNIQQSVAGAFRKGLSSVTGAFRRKGGGGGGYTEEELELELSNLRRPPKMQAGGYVKKGGLIEAHAAEVVTPVEKIFTQFQSMNAELVKAMRSPLNRAARSLKEIKEHSAESIENSKKVVSNLAELRSVLIGTTDQIKVSWQAMLNENPFFRKVLKMAEVLNTVVVSPIKWLFGMRGGYRGMATRATATSNVFLKISNMLQLIFGQLMPKVDRVIEILNRQLEYMTGERVPEIKGRGTYTMFGKIKEFFTTRSIQTAGETVFDSVVDALRLDRSALEEAGITSIGDFLMPHRWVKNMGVTRENIASKLKGKGEGGIGARLASVVEREKSFKEAAKEQTEVIKESVARVNENIKESKKVLKEQHEERISVAQEHYQATLKRAKMSEEQQEKISEIMETWKDQSLTIGKKSVDASKFVGKKVGGLGKTYVKQTTRLISGIARRIKKLVPRLGSMLLTMFNILSFTLGNMLRAIGKILIPIASFLGSGIMRMLAAGPIGILKGAGLMAGGMAAGAAGLTMGTIDAFRGFGRAEEWGVGRGAAMAGAFFGGVGGGTLKSAAWGAAKGGALGAAIGLVVPGVGPAIGGAVGAIAGAILGFVGGKNISKAFSAIGKEITKVVKAVWKVVTFPIKLLYRVAKGIIKGFYRIFKFPISLIARFVKWWVGKVWSVITWPLVKILSLFGIQTGPSELGDWIAEKIAWLWKAITAPVRNFFTMVNNIMDAADKGTQNLDEMIADAMYNVVTWPLRKLGELLTKLKDWIVEKISPIASFFGIDLGVEESPREGPSPKSDVGRAFRNQRNVETMTTAAEIAAGKNVGKKIVDAINESSKTSTAAVIANSSRIIASTSQVINQNNNNVGGTSPGMGNTIATEQILLSGMM